MIIIIIVHFSLNTEASNCLHYDDNVISSMKKVKDEKILSPHGLSRASMLRFYTYQRQTS